MYCIGETRFSLLKPGSYAWRASNNSNFKSLDEYRSYLYDEKRLAFRANIFINHSLPQLERASRGHNYKHIVRYSDSLPFQAKRRLKTAARKYPFLILDEATESNPDGVSISEIASTMFSGGSGVFGTFRIDDDDLLGIDFFEKMQPYVSMANLGHQISLGLGYTAQWNGEEYYNFRSVRMPMIAIGLMTVCATFPDGTVYIPATGPHIESDKYVPVILDSREPAFLWNRHEGQDSAISSDPNKTASRIANSIGQFTPVSDFVAVKRQFPEIQSRIRIPKTRELISESTRLTQSFDIDLGEPERNVELILSATFDNQASERNALVSFEACDRDGQPIPNDIVVPGLSLSGRDDVGYFRYLRSDSNALQSFVFSGPENVYCKKVRILKWKPRTTRITLLSARLNV